MEKEGQLRFNSDGSIQLPQHVREDIEKFKIERAERMDIWDDEDFDEQLHHLDENVKGFNLFSFDKKLHPLRFSNGKTQEDVVNEVVENVRNGRKVIFIKGVCGTGKSAIALNISKALGRASIVVPGKALQKQYHEDYTKKSYVIKDDNKKLKIKVISGRQNHKCMYDLGKSADDPMLPCKIEIKESNIEKLREYLKQNPKVKDDLDLKEIRRVSVAPVCPYWSPIIPSEYDIPFKTDKKKYQGLQEIEFTIHNRKKGCSYYNQFNSYVDGEAIVFNSAKYKLETLMNRKPSTAVEIIDESDEFLDSFSNIKKINLSRLYNSLNAAFMEDDKADFILKKVRELVFLLLRDEEIRNLTDSKNVVSLSETKIADLFRYFLDNPEFTHEIDEDSYLNTLYETAKDFEDFFDESFIQFSHEDRGLSFSIVTTNLKKRFEELLDKVNAIVFMSGTLHDENVLRNVFGIDDFVVIDAEIEQQGKFEIIYTGSEFDCRYSNFSSGNYSRKDYLMALNDSISKSIKPTLVHVNAFDDLPNENEKFEHNLDSLMSKERLQSLNEESEEMILKFKRGEIPVLFTTKCSRGVDFPKQECNSIVFTKYPNPNVNSIFWKILNRTHPQWYWTFYRDKAKREFLQKLYRGLRSKDDHVYVLSPDKRVLDYLESLSRLPT